MSHGQRIKVEQRPRAETDVAVAAASIIAREAFIDWLDHHGRELGVRLDRGVSPGVKQAARQIVAQGGPDALRKVAKLHFRTAHEVAPEAFPAPPPRRPWRK
jgi:ribonuclease HIII